MEILNTIVLDNVKTNVFAYANTFNENQKMTLASRIKTARELAKLSQEDLADAVGCSVDLIRKLEQGNRKNTTFKIKIANICKVDPTWLDVGDVDEISSIRHLNQELNAYQSNEIDLQNNDEYPSIKRVNLKLSAGIVGFSIDYDVENKTPIVMRKDWFLSRGYKPEKLIAVEVKGDSMQTGLHDGDTVVINTYDITPKDGEVFAINYEGEMLIKRMVRDSGSWWLYSDNPDQRKYPRKECNDNNCLIIGKIVHKQSERI